MANKKILCVDDDEKILKGIQRQQGDDFDITIAIGPKDALQIIEDEGPFAVVVSDMRMPEMNGVELLKIVRQVSPNTVRMMLTGFAELNTTIEAINEGNIFRFLAKPCNAENLAAAFEAALQQYALIEAEKELVEGTLHGSVKVLSEVLSLVNPLAFGQSTRVRGTVDGILKRYHVENSWQLEIAAMLLSLGCVTLPEDLLQKKLAGQSLGKDEEEIVSGHPEIARDLLQSIPRLENVANFIALQNTPTATQSVDEQPVPIEARILKMALDYDMQELASDSSLHALNELKNNAEHYDAEILEALCDYIKTERNLQFAEITVSQLVEGMVLAEDITDTTGRLLMSKGQKITSSANRLIFNFSKNKTIKEPIKVIVSHSNCHVAAGV